MRTSELTGAALDWAVAQCEHNVGWELEGEDRDCYSADWLQGGPIIEREGLHITPIKNRHVEGLRWKCELHTNCTAFGSTLLIAAMRCYVASKLGDEVELPAELI